MSQILFKVYSIVFKDQKVLARFTSSLEAEKTKNWLKSRVFKNDNVSIDVTNITNDNYYTGYDALNTDGKNYETFEDYKKYIQNKSKNSVKYYTLKEKKHAYVMVDNFWWEYDTSTPLNDATILSLSAEQHFGWDLTETLIIEADDWADLDWNNTEVLNDEYKTGWLSPDGKFFGCSNRSHQLQSRLIHKKHEDVLEIEGWIKIARDIDKKGQIKAYLNRNKNGKLILPSTAQMDYLKKSEINNYDEIIDSIKYNFAGFNFEIN